MTNNVSQDIQPKLLIVDDDTLIAKILREIAERSGFEVSCINDGKQIASQLVTFDPDVIFLDLIMPGFDGVEVLGVLAEANCSAKIVLMSGMDKRTLSMVSKVVKDKELELLGAITKPFTAQDIEKILIPLAQDIKENKAMNPEQSRLDKFGLQLFIEPHLQFNGQDESKLRWASVNLVWKLDNGEVVPLETILTKDAITNSAKGSVISTLQELANSNQYFQQADLKLGFALPLSNVLFDDPELPDLLERVVNQSNLSPSEIRLEIDETSVLNGSARTNDMLSRFKIKGFGVAVCVGKEADQILSSLNSLAIDELVIDMSYGMDREDILNDIETEFQYSSLASVALKSGVETSAKNVASSRQLEFAKKCKFSRVRGQGVSEAGDVRSVVAFYQ